LKLRNRIRKIDIAEGAPEEIIGVRGMEDIDLRFGIPLWAGPWRVCVRPTKYVHELLLPVKVVVSDVVKKADLFE
jgi:hypothetical protein